MARPILQATLNIQRVPGARDVRAWLCGIFVAAVVLLSGTSPVSAVVRGAVSGSAETGFARLVFVFDEPVAHTATLANGVLVIDFSDAIEIDASTLIGEVPAYISAARLDPDKKTLRFALGQRLAVNSISARDRVFVDLLPENWVGPPPGLPEDVIAELIRLAEEDATRAARDAAGQGAARNELEIRVGRYPTFSRIVFAWGVPTRTTLSRETDNVTLTFNRPSEVDLSRLNGDPPPQLVSAAASHGEESLTLVLEVEPGTDVRGFREADTYVVDLAVNAPEEQIADALTGDDGQSTPALPDARGMEGEIRVSGGASAQETPGANDDLVSISVTPLEIGGNPIGDDSSQGAADPGEVDRTDPAISGRGDETVADTAGDDERSPEVSDAMFAEGREAGDEAEGGDPSAPIVVAAKTVGSTLRLTFPFVEPIASAAFQRANTLWLVFDTDAPIQTDAIARESSGVVSDVHLVRAAGLQLLRLTLSGQFLATSTTRGNRWIVTLGDLVLAPTQPLVLQRSLRTDGLSKVSVALEGSGQVHWISDSEIGDQIAVVTAFGPPRGQIKRQEFVEFTALPTAHGLAIRPHADDLAVRLVQDEVVITRERGLTLSAGRWPQYVPGAETATNATRPGFVDFATWKGDPTMLLRRKVQQIIGEIAREPADNRANLRLRLVRLMIAHELGVEALGIMDIAEEEDADVVNDPVFRSMRGIAQIMAGRFEDARADLFSRDLDDDPHVALWRGIAAVENDDWRSALLSFESGHGALEAYEPAQQARFHLAAARAGLEANELDVAARNLDALSDVNLDDRGDAERALLAARLSEAFGRDEQAMEEFAAIAQSRIRPVAAEAELRRILLFLRDGRMTTDAAIVALESVAVTWRGDRIELAALRKLAELYADEGRYRDALETMKIAVVNHEASQRTRLIADDMTTLFNRIFLDGEGEKMEPIAALGLYYDFRELTPVGRRGDEMIRKLAHRLVDVDLLDQAADLLEHQVNNRLSGAGRAQVAADLSLINLMAHKPELALQAIRKTRQAVLPESLQHRRNLLEARALADLGRVELSIEILNSMSGPEVERLKSDALWRGKRWQAAGEQIERMLNARWQDAEPLDDLERRDVLRAAIGYSIANDTLGLERLRRKYTSKMASSPDASSFEVVTGTVERDGAAIDALAREIASIDTLETFLDDFRNRYGASDGADGVATPAGQGSDAGI